MYAFVGRPSDEAYVILRVEDPDRAINVLSENNINVLPSSEVYDL